MTRHQLMGPRAVTGGICLGLVLLAGFAYGDLLGGEKYEFVNFDDYHYVRDNPHIHEGLTGASVWWALTSFAANNWHPLTWMSLQLDWQLYGNNPRGFHITNLLLHTVNAVLLFVALRRLSGATWPAALAAAFFAVHPLHVESVAWVTERKDVLSTCFWLLTLLAYARFVESPHVGRYLLLCLCLSLGLMSKPMVVTLPCVLLLLDYWPLRRFSRVALRQLVLEKLPLLLLAAVCARLTMLAQSGLLETAQEAFPVRVRLLNALVSYVTYLRQMVWPTDLAVLYVHPGDSLTLTDGLRAGGLLVAVTLLALFWRSRRPYVLVGWLWYLGTLVPVIGLLQVGQQAHADRYTYVPLIGIYIALAWTATDCLGRLTLAPAALLLVLCVLTTRAQVPHWRNSTTLFDRVLQVSGDDPHLHAVTVAQCLHEREVDAAVVRATTFRQLYPDNWQSHWYLGTALARQGNLDEALPNLQRALALQPESAAVHKELASILTWQGKIPAAFRHSAVVARLQPNSLEGLYYRGIVAHHDGNLAEAVACFQAALPLAPDGVMHRVNLALALEDLGDRIAASNEYTQATDINPSWPDHCDRQARTLATHPDAARRHGREALRLARAACSFTNQKYPPFLETLAAAHAETGQFKQAVDIAERARELAQTAGAGDLVARLDAALRLYRHHQPLRGGQP